MIKLNLGCGSNIIEGADWVNVDRYLYGEGVAMFDLESTPWPWRDDEVNDVIFNHSLEHMGQDPKVFLAMIGELYRICQHGAKIRITVPHYRSDDFWGDPTHVRVITPELLSLFSKTNCAEFRKIGAANTRFAELLNVDFEIDGPVSYVIDEYWQKMFAKPGINRDTIATATRTYYNVIKEMTINWKVIKNVTLPHDDQARGSVFNGGYDHTSKTPSTALGTSQEMARRIRAAH